MNQESYIIRCGSCGTGNRIPVEREGQAGRCGQCGSPLLPLYIRPQQLSERNFDSFVSSYQGTILVEFWAPWCSHCVSFEPVVKSIAARLAGQAAVVKVNTQENPALASRFSIRGIPAMMLMKHGRVIDRREGTQPAESVIAWFQSNN